MQGRGRREGGDSRLWVVIASDSVILGDRHNDEKII
jgi:hypothetical protein